MVTRQKAPGDRGEYLRKLQVIGLTDYESRSLIALLESNPSTAYEVAKQAGLPRANVYAALEGLVAKNAIQPISQNPARYVPVEPSVFLGRIAESTSEICRELIDGLANLKQRETLEYVWSIPDRDATHAKIAELINTADRHIWIKADIEHIRMHLAELGAATKRGVAIAKILFGSEADRQLLTLGPSVRVYLHEGSGVPVGQSEHLLSITTDFTHALTASLREGGYGVYTQNRPVVVLVESLIRHEIYMAEIFESLGPQVEALFGRSLLHLREKYLPANEAAQLKHSFNRGRAAE